MNAGEMLKRRGMRVTTRRVRLLESIQGIDRPASAAEIRERLGGGSPDLATIYRTLERFVSSGLAQAVDFGDGVRRFESAGRSHHHHLVCTSCGNIGSLAACSIEALEEEAMKMHGFQVARHSLEFFGVCSACAEASS